jgi:hypothetical protein
MQHGDNFAERIKGEREPEPRHAAPQPTAQLVQLHMWQIEVRKEALVQRCAVPSGTCEPGGDGRMPMPEHAHGRADIQAFGQGRQHFGNSVGSGFQPIERRHPEGNGGAC